MTNQPNGIKQQHFVPKFYLENFSQDGLLNVYDRVERRFFTPSPANMCKQNYIYETVWKSADPELGKFVLFNQLEKEFSEKEKRWSTIIKKIIRRYELNKSMLPSGLICTKEEIDELTEFIACTFLRHPYQLKKTNEYYSDLISEDSSNIFVYFVEALFNLWGWGSSKSFLEHTVKTTTFNPDLEGSPLNVLKSIIQRMNMFFICSNTKQFMTSSFPVFGTNSDYQQVFFPISPYIIVCCSDASDTRNKRNRFIQVTEELVEILNTMYLTLPENICRYLISQDKEILDFAISGIHNQNK